MRGCRLVLGGGKAGDALLERRKLNDAETVEVFRPFHDPVASAPRQDLPAVSSDDVRNEVGVLLVLNRIRNSRAGHPVSRHVSSRLSSQYRLITHLRLARCAP